MNNDITELTPAMDSDVVIVKARRFSLYLIMYVTEDTKGHQSHQKKEHTFGVKEISFR